MQIIVKYCKKTAIFFPIIITSLILSEFFSLHFHLFHRLSFSIPFSFPPPHPTGPIPHCYCRKSVFVTDGNNLSHQYINSPLNFYVHQLSPSTLLMDIFMSINSSILLILYHKKTPYLDPIILLLIFSFAAPPSAIILEK